MKAKSMFPGLHDFEKVVRRQGKQVPARELDRFFLKLESTLNRISERYVQETTDRNSRAGVPEERTRDEIDGLRLALRDTKSTPFSEVVSPYVEIESGIPTELGRRLLMSDAVAEAINGPTSDVVELMKSLTKFDIPFEMLAKASYEAFNYAKSNIALASGGGSVQARPLLWLPLGNSLFVSEVIDVLRTAGEPVTVINMGAGPGALEQMFSNHIDSPMSDRLHVVSIEMDRANLESLARVSRSLKNHRIIEGDFVSTSIQETAERTIPPNSIKLVIAGYALHHISPDNTGMALNWMKKLAGNRGLIQVHDVLGGKNGGGQSQVNRLFFNFMTAYHLLVFHPDSFFTERNFSVMKADKANELVGTRPELFAAGTTPENVREMLQNGSVVVFRSGGLEGA